MIDSPFPTGWRAALLTFSQMTGLSYKFGPAPIAARRRHTWVSRNEARAFFAAKPFVQKWRLGVLDDFIDHAIIDTPDGAVTLRAPRDAERDIYAHVVHKRARGALGQLRKHNIAIHFIAGKQSEEMRLGGYPANRTLFSPHWTELDAGHLIPLEMRTRFARVQSRTRSIVEKDLRNRGGYRQIQCSRNALLA